MEKDNEITVTSNSASDTIVIDLSSTYGATTSYINDGMYTITGSGDTIQISDGTVSVSTISTDWLSNIDLTSVHNNINEDEVEQMCKEYPGLEKVWKNFKSVYDMVKQDYEGKKKAGEL